MDPLLTRRQTIQTLALSGLFGGPLLSLVGCGGGGGGRHGSGSTASTSVPVVLPAGFSIPATDLVGGTAYGTGAVQNGAFKATISSDGPTFAYLRQKSTGKFVLFGLVGPGRPGVTPIATAALTMAIALGFTGLPGDNLAQALTLLEEDASVKTLGDAIAGAMASDPYAANGTSDAVKAAIAAAYSALSGTGSRSAGRTESRATVSSLLLVEPTGDQGGFRFDQVEDGSITPTNLKRRPAIAYTYRVGHTTADATTDVSPAQRVDMQELAGTLSLVGSLGSLGVQIAGLPVTGKAVELPVAQGDVKTFYSSVVLMASTDQGGEPSFFSDPHYANEVAEWRQKRADLNSAGFVGILRDVFAPLAATAAQLSVSAASAIVTQVTTAAAAANQTAFLAQVQAGQYGEFAQYILSSVGQDGYTAQAALTCIEETVGIAPAAAGTATVSAILGLATVAAATLGVCVSALALADIASSYWDVASSPQAALWSETAIKPSVVISPAAETIAAGVSLTLTAGTPGTSETNYKFHWTMSSGGNGNIGDPTGASSPGRDVTTAGTTINLATAPSDTAGTIYTITVTAIDLKTGESLGTATAKITISAEDPGQIGQYFSVTGSIPSGTYAGNYYVAAFVTFTPVPGSIGYSALAKAPDGSMGTGYVQTDQLPYVFPDGQTFNNCVMVYGDPTGATDSVGSQAAAESSRTSYVDAHLKGLTWRVYSHPGS